MDLCYMLLFLRKVMKYRYIVFTFRNPLRFVVGITKLAKLAKSVSTSKEYPIQRMLYHIAQTNNLLNNNRIFLKRTSCQILQKLFWLLYQLKRININI